jgi:hypothetical protein
LTRHEIHIYVHIDADPRTGATIDQGGQADQLIDGARRAAHEMEAPLRDLRRRRALTPEVVKIDKSKWGRARARIKVALHNARMTHAQAAELFGIPRSSFSSYMSKGNSRPNRELETRMLEWTVKQGEAS